ncbi:hypothetical protein KP509_14G066100 [Ceratopteris richardii]|uniref:Chitinase n=1 Tax=Ceratopteris richardii TaxID=49495 RepID=A0A8T2TCM0_CERRI|nr:hypothetical protein KP509_1Z264800 [Ceratopteris richardii]KAH7415915.1 hypothetical protein KP509_14G066100 [Ceratopteris richardii]
MPNSPSSGSCTTYTVKSGDTCYAISQANGISLSNFQSWNSGINCNNLQIGQKVCISQPSGSSSSSNYNGKIFREYIGALYNIVNFNDVPINTGVSFHFILSAVIDYTSSASPTNGLFNIYWQNSMLNRAAVQAIISQYSNVRVIGTLGGDTISGQPVHFRATSVNSWVSNAVFSVTSLISQYHLDGIDIEYEHFDSVSTDTFVSCIAQLIQQLKSSGVIPVASIAPFDEVQTHYKALWDQYNNVIDLVNFQLYSYRSSTSASEFVSYYNTAAATYGGGARYLRASALEM